MVEHIRLHGVIRSYDDCKLWFTGYNSISVLPDCIVFRQSSTIFMAEKRQQPESVSFRPSDFMRARRPYLFSDTQVVGKSLLDRSFLEYHLETLTNRKQELEFENFCRKLAEKELCPNLLPQTGPTGGGTAK